MHILREFSDASKVKDVSSAYWEIKCALSPTFIPLIFSFCLINIAKISAQSINIYGDRGSPCLQPLFILNHSHTWPFTRTQELIFL